MDMGLIIVLIVTIIGINLLTSLVMSILMLPLALFMAIIVLTASIVFSMVMTYESTMGDYNLLMLAFGGSLAVTLFYSHYRFKKKKNNRLDPR